MNLMSLFFLLLDVSSISDNIAAVKAFDEYISVMQDYVDPFVFIPKCISCELLERDVSAFGGTALFLTNKLKMETVLKEIRNNISLNGVKKLRDLIELFHSEPIYNELANHLEGIAPYTHIPYVQKNC